MPVDIGLREWAYRDNLKSLAAGDIEHVADQSRADAVTLKRLGDFGVQDGEHAVGALVVRKGDMPISIEFEAMTLGVVANVVGHFKVDVTVSAQS